MSPLITLTKNQLKKLLPEAKSIDIRIEPDHGHYLTKIHIRMPGAILHAQKRAERVTVAIDQTVDAVLKQFEKRKARLWQKEPAHV